MEKIRKCTNPFFNRYQLFMLIFGFAAGLVSYFAMYAFRKPFTVIKWEKNLWGIDYKILLIIFQTVGYTLSKFYGVYFVSKLTRFNRGLQVVILVGLSLIAWILFALVPVPYNFWVIAISAFPLGVIWGLVFSFFEGRSGTEFLTCGMCISQIIASGYVKTVGEQLIRQGVPAIWMPAAVGAIFMVPLIIASFCLELLPPPNEEDIARCSERKPMLLADQKKFVKTFFPGFIILITSYVVTLVYRDLRDNFSPEMWRDAGYSDSPSIYSTSELIVGTAVLIPIAVTLFVKNKSIVFFFSFPFVIFDCVLLIILTMFYSFGKINTDVWIVATGVCLYLVYIPYSTVIFESWLSTFAYPATSGFLMYSGDALGYLVSAILYVLYQLSWKGSDILPFFEITSYIIFSILILLMLSGYVYFYFKYDHGKGKMNNPVPKDIESIEQMPITSDGIVVAVPEEGNNQDNIINTNNNNNVDNGDNKTTQSNESGKEIH